MDDPNLVLTVVFFKSESGREPVRDWLKALDRDQRIAIGEDIKLIQFRWPLGMPRVRKLDRGLWEARSKLPNGQIARTFFTIVDNQMVLLHGFIKKSQKTPAKELKLAQQRKALWLDGI